MATAAEGQQQASSTAQRNRTVDEYLLHITVNDDPFVERHMHVPSGYMFSQLQEALQVAFGWNGIL